MCRSSGGNANAPAVEVEPVEPEEEREIQHVWVPVGWFVYCNKSNLPSNECGDLLNMIMDFCAEGHAVSLVDWKSLCQPVLKLRSATGDDMGGFWQFYGALMVRQSNGGVDGSGGDSNYKISVFCDEAGECWLQHLF